MDDDTTSSSTSPATAVDEQPPVLLPTTTVAEASTTMTAAEAEASRTAEEEEAVVTATTPPTTTTATSTTTRPTAVDDQPPVLLPTTTAAEALTTTTAAAAAAEASTTGEEEEAVAAATTATIPPPATSTATTYEHVFCGDAEEGRLEVTERGLFFRPYGSPTYRITTPNNNPAARPHDIPYGDMTARDFQINQVEAGYGGYVVMVTNYDFKVGVWPSREVTFHFGQGRDEWERFQCDLEARGQGAPPPAPEQPDVVWDNDEDNDNEADGHHPAPGFQTEDYDYTPQHEEEETEWHEDDDDEDVEEGHEFHDDQGGNHQDGENNNVGWSADDDDDDTAAAAAAAATTPNSTYYPVVCKREVGSLVLTANGLKFIPDRHSANIKDLPWNAFAGKPDVAPFNYPQATMQIHYHTTRGPYKQVGFTMTNHQELQQLQEDVTNRLRPWKNAPRHKVYVPPRPPPSSVDKRKTQKGFQKPGFFKKKHKNKVAPVPVGSTMMDDNTTTADYTDSDDIDTPLVVTATPLYLRRRTHKEESSHKMLLLFMIYCCIITWTGLTLSILFGYFFGPRVTRGGEGDEQYVRTRSPWNIQQDYLGTKAPTTAPTESPTPSPTIHREQSTVPPQWLNELRPIARPPLRPGVPPRTNVNTTTANNNNNDESREGRSSSEPNVTTTTTTVAPTASSTVEQTRSNKTIGELLTDESFDGGTALRTTGSPQQAAYLLLKLSGVVDTSPSDAMILQKYALSTLYYSTGGEQWTDGSVDWMELDVSDCLKEHLVCDEPTQATVWIDMPSNHMHGSLPAEVAMLSRLTRLNFADNALTGTIPTELGLLTNLETLDLSNNTGLQGTVPVEVQRLPNLKTLKVDHLPSS